MSTRTLRVVAHLRSKPDKVEEARAALTALIGPTRGENGCVAYELLQNNADPTDFTFVEEWTDDGVLDVHLESDHIKDLVSRAADLFAAEPDIRRYTLVA